MSTLLLASLAIQSMLALFTVSRAAERRETLRARNRVWAAYGRRAPSLPASALLHRR